MFLNLIQCLIKGIVQFSTYLVERVVNIVTVSADMLCSMYRQHRSGSDNIDQEDSRITTPAQMQPQLTRHQQILESQNENQPFIPLSPMSTTTVVSIPVASTAPPSPPQPQPQSTTQKALRFINIPVKARRQESGAQVAVPPTAPSPTFMTGMPGTPRRLF